MVGVAGEQLAGGRDTPSSPLEPWVFHPGGSTWLTLPRAAILLPRPPLTLGLRGHRPALPNVSCTPVPGSSPLHRHKGCVSL